MQLTKTTHVALAASRHAIAQPMLFACDLAAKLVQIAFFLFQNLVTPFLKMRKALIDATGNAAIKPHSRTADIFKKATVMRDQHDSRTDLTQFVFQPFNGIEIEMVCRLIKQQHIRLRRDHACKGCTARLTTRQMIGFFFASKAQMLKKIGYAMRIICRSKPGFDICTYIGKTIKVRHLRQITNRRARMLEHFARGRLDHIGRDFEQSGLA